MRRLAAVAFAAVVLAGCNEVRVNPSFDYAVSSQGYRNSGLLQPGQLFFWDRADNTLVSLEPDAEIPLRPVGGPVDLAATNVRGVDLDLSARYAAVAAEIGARIGSNVEFRIDDAQRFRARSVGGPLADAFTSISDEPEVRLRRWKFRTHQADRARYKYVLITDKIAAQTDTIKVVDEAALTFDLDLPGEDPQTFKVVLSDAASARCSAPGEGRADCYFGVKVYDFFIRPNGNLDFESVQFDAQALSAAFRRGAGLAS